MSGCAISPSLRLYDSEGQQDDCLFGLQLDWPDPSGNISLAWVVQPQQTVQNRKETDTACACSPASLLILPRQTYARHITTPEGQAWLQHTHPSCLIGNKPSKLAPPLPCRPTTHGHNPNAAFHQGPDRVDTRPWGRAANPASAHLETPKTEPWVTSHETGQHPAAVLETFSCP